MSRIRLASLCAALLAWQAALTGGSGSLSGAVHAGHGKGKKPAKEAEKKKEVTEDVNLLSMEVGALRVLRGLDATPAQLAEIARVAKNTVEKPRKREPAKAASAYVATLKELRAALVANDEEKVEALQEKLEDLEEKNPPDLDDDIEISDTAELQAEPLLKKFSPVQLAGYAVSLGDNFPDPVQLILDGLEEGRGLKGEEWEDARDELADRISWLLGGLNGERTLKVEEEVSAFLDRKHGEKGSGRELEAEVRKLVGPPDPIALLKNVVEHDLAELLSNPQVETAVKACLDKGKK